jgi:hypothetical protein
MLHRVWALIELGSVQLTAAADGNQRGAQNDLCLFSVPWPQKAAACNISIFAAETKTIGFNRINNLNTVGLKTIRVFRSLAPEKRHLTSQQAELYSTWIPTCPACRMGALATSSSNRTASFLHCFHGFQVAGSQKEAERN